MGESGEGPLNNYLFDAWLVAGNVAGGAAR